MYSIPLQRAIQIIDYCPFTDRRLIFCTTVPARVPSPL